MSNFGSTFPIFTPTGAPAGAAEVLIGGVNRAWGQTGSGSIKFWEDFGPLIFRDTTTASGGLRYKNGYYPLISAQGQVYSWVGDNEVRNSGKIAGKILCGPSVGRRVDGPSVPFDTVNPSDDPMGELRDAVQQQFGRWADYLPLQTVIGGLVNGRISAAHPVWSCYDNQPLFSTQHLVNPLDPKTEKYSNKVALGGPIDQTGWGKIKDQFALFKDLDGVTLPNADMGLPIVMLPNWQAWLRWAAFLGGPNINTSLLIPTANGQAAVQSMVVGDAVLMVNHYLTTLATDKAAIAKKAFIFNPNGRKFCIYREEVAPTVDTVQKKENNTIEVYIQARIDAIPGEPRSVLEVTEA